MVIFSIILFFAASSSYLQDFKAVQKKYPRVRAAYAEKGNYISSKLNSAGIKLHDLNILLVAFKAEKKLELWVKSQKEKKYVLLETYNVCKTSGTLGPKKKQGDKQIPEGFYYIDRYNPSSNFHLSLGINYPNQSDNILSKHDDPGGDIFIHGECVTIGCLPITNDKIKEIYLYAIEAKNNGQHKIPVYIFPTKLSDKNFSMLQYKYQRNPELINFWTSLKQGYDLFLGTNTEINYFVNNNGNYQFP